MKQRGLKRSMARGGGTDRRPKEVFGRLDRLAGSCQRPGWSELLLRAHESEWGQASLAVYGTLGAADVTK